MTVPCCHCDAELVDRFVIDDEGRGVCMDCAKERGIDGREINLSDAPTPTTSGPSG